MLKVPTTFVLAYQTILVLVYIVLVPLAASIYAVVNRTRVLWCTCNLRWT